MSDESTPVDPKEFTTDFDDQREVNLAQWNDLKQELETERNASERVRTERDDALAKVDTLEKANADLETAKLRLGEEWLEKYTKQAVELNQKISDVTAERDQAQADNTSLRQNMANYLTNTEAGKEAIRELKIQSLVDSVNSDIAQLKALGVNVTMGQHQ